MASHQCHAQGFKYEYGFQTAPQCPADAASRKGIQQNRQIHELHLQADVGDVGHPELIDARQHHFLGYIRVDRQPVLGIGGEKKLSLSQTQQVVRPHQPQNAFVIYAPALAQQFGMHTTIAIGWPS